MLFHAICRFFIVLLVIYAVLSRFFGANIFGPFLHLCYFNRFFHLCIYICGWWRCWSPWRWCCGSVPGPVVELGRATWQRGDRRSENRIIGGVKTGIEGLNKNQSTFNQRIWWDNSELKIRAQGKGLKLYVDLIVFVFLFVFRCVLPWVGGCVCGIAVTPEYYSEQCSHLEFDHDDSLCLCWYQSWWQWCSWKRFCVVVFSVCAGTKHEDNKGWLYLGHYTISLP